MNSSRADEDICPICLERYSKPNNQAEFVCVNRHRMCGSCLDSLLTSQNSALACPECRKPLLVSSARLKEAVFRKNRGRRIEPSSMDLLAPPIPLMNRAGRNLPRINFAPMRPPPVFYEPAQIIIHREVEPVPPPAIRQPIVPGNGCAGSQIWSIVVSIVSVLLVWVPTAANIYYYLHIQPIFVYVLLYLMCCQFYNIASNTNRIHEGDSLENRTKQFVKQLLLFTLCQRISDRINLSAFLFHLKELGLIAAVVLITIFQSNKHWTSMEIIVIAANGIAAIGNPFVEKYHVDAMLNDSWRWLSTHQHFRNIMLYTSYVCCWAAFGYSFYVFWKISPVAFGIELFAVCWIAITTLCATSSLECAAKMKGLFSLPFVVSTFLNVVCCSCWIWTAFFIRYVQIPALFATMLYFTLTGRQTQASAGQLIAALLMSLFSSVQIVIGNSVW